jgi:Ca-activated chloride channel family protein
VLTSVPELPAVPKLVDAHLGCLAKITSPVEDNNNSSSNPATPVDIVFVVDRSGSMGGQPINTVKKLLNFATTYLDEKDRMGIITFGDDATEVLPLTRMTVDGAVRARARIEHIRHDGMTNLHGGLMAGIDMMRARDDESADVAAVVLLTDGLPTTGKVLMQDDIVDVMTEANVPCPVHTFGFSESHDPKMLKVIAEQGRGTYTFVENANDIGKYMATLLGGVKNTVAKDLKLTIRAANGATIRAVRTGFDVEENSMTGEYVVTVADMQRGEQRSVLVEADVPEVSAVIEDFEFLSLDMEYTDVADKSVAKVSCAAKTNRTETTSPLYSEEVCVERNRQLASEAMKTALEHAYARNVRRAKCALDDAIIAIKSSKFGLNEASRQIALELEKFAEDFSNEGAFALKFDTGGLGHTMATYVSASASQRSADPTPSATMSIYSTPVRAAAATQYMSQKDDHYG